MTLRIQFRPWGLHQRILGQRFQDPLKSVPEATGLTNTKPFDRLICDGLAIVPR